MADVFGGLLIMWLLISPALVAGLTVTVIFLLMERRRKGER
jgi:hypothetical protein